MDQPRRGGGCARADVALFQKNHPQAASRGVARHTDAVQAAADDRKIVVRHARTIAFSSEVDTGSREEKASSKKRGSALQRTLASLARGLHRVAAAPANHRGVLSDRLRSADKITLHRVAALVREEGELLLGFHALGDDRHLQAVAKADHRPNDRRRLVVASEIHDQNAVDLDFVEWERLK